MVPVLKQGLPISKGKIKCHETYLGVVNTKISFYFGTKQLQILSVDIYQSTQKFRLIPKRGEG